MVAIATERRELCSTLRGLLGRLAVFHRMCPDTIAQAEILAGRSPDASRREDERHAQIAANAAARAEVARVQQAAVVRPVARPPVDPDAPGSRYVGQAPRSSLG